MVDYGGLHLLEFGKAGVGQRQFSRLVMQSDVVLIGLPLHLHLRLVLHTRDTLRLPTWELDMNQDGLCTMVAEA